MAAYSSRKPFPFARWAVIPAVLLAVCASGMIGFTNGLLSPGVRTHELGPSAQSVGGEGPEVSGGTESGEAAVQGADPLDAYAMSLDLLQRRYYGARIDSHRARTLTYEAIRGMLGSLRDQFTSYLDPGEWQQMETMTEGDFGGVGAFMLQAGDKIKIDRPMPGGPADKAGVKPNDILVSIDGKAVRGRNVDDLFDLLQGAPNTVVRLGILRGKQTLVLPVTRAVIEPVIVQHWMEDNRAKIGHIVLTEFNRKSITQMNAAFADLERQGVRALVFDLRFNPGGLLDAAQDVASVFIPENSKPELHNNVVIIHHGDGEEEGLPLEPEQHKHGQLPLVVLVNGSSASASEIVTGAIRDYGVGTIIGERTFGKGKVQTLFEMSHGRDGGLRLTTSLYYPPKHYDINFEHDDDGNRIPGTGGIVPDIVVPESTQWKEDFEDKANDNQLQTALIFLRARLEKKSMAEATQLAQRYADTEKPARTALDIVPGKPHSTTR